MTHTGLRGIQWITWHILTWGGYSGSHDPYQPERDIVDHKTHTKLRGTLNTVDFKVKHIWKHDLEIMVGLKLQSSELIFWSRTDVAYGLRGYHLGYSGLLIDSYLGHGICQLINRHWQYLHRLYHKICRTAPKIIYYILHHIILWLMII